MRALVLSEQNKLELCERAKPELKQADDLIIKVLQTGICGTDRSVLMGKFSAKPGVIMGHETVGLVQERGLAVSKFKIGDRVVINPTLYCGKCQSCLNGSLKFCLNKAGTEIGIDRDGAFAEFIRLSELFCHHIPDEMSLDRAVMIEPLACVLNNLESGELSAGETLIIIGGGPIGILCAMAGSFYGTKVILVEKDPYRLSLCQNIMAASCHTYQACQPSDCPLKSGDVVVDSVGNMLEQSVEYVSNGGRVVIMGYNNKSIASIKPLELVQRGLKIIGAGDYNSQIFPRAIEIAKSLPLERIISHYFPMTRFEDAFSALSPSNTSNYSALKVIIRPTE